MTSLRSFPRSDFRVTPHALRACCRLKWPPRISKMPAMNCYCHPSPSLVLLSNVDLPSEERSNVQQLLLLYVCLFWRAEAKQLGIQPLLQEFPAHRQKRTGRWVFCFASNEFRMSKHKEETCKC